jgi:hypothetical protein
MKKIPHKQNCFFRRWAKKLFSSWSKCQCLDYSSEFQKVLEKLQDIEDTIEIIAREIARQAMRSK